MLEKCNSKSFQQFVMSDCWQEIMYKLNIKITWTHHNTFSSHTWWIVMSWRLTLEISENSLASLYDFRFSSSVSILSHSFIYLSVPPFSNTTWSILTLILTVHWWNWWSLLTSPTKIIINLFQFHITCSYNINNFFTLLWCFHTVRYRCRVWQRHRWMGTV